MIKCTIFRPDKGRSVLNPDIEHCSSKCIIELVCNKTRYYKKYLLQKIKFILISFNSASKMMQPNRKKRSGFVNLSFFKDLRGIFEIISFFVNLHHTWLIMCPLRTQGLLALKQYLYEIVKLNWEKASDKLKVVYCLRAWYQTIRKHTV